VAWTQSLWRGSSWRSIDCRSPWGTTRTRRSEPHTRWDSTPSNFFIDKTGVLVERKIGAFERDMEEAFVSRIEKLLAQ